MQQDREVPGVGVALHGQDLVVYGAPLSSEDSDRNDDDLDLLHNCDAMGCGQVHALVRIPLSPLDFERLRIHSRTVDPMQLHPITTGGS